MPPDIQRITFKKNSARNNIKFILHGIESSFTRHAEKPGKNLLQQTEKLINREK